MMSANKSIREFFDPKPAMEPGAPSPSPAFKVPSGPAMRSSSIPATSTQTPPPNSSAPNSSAQQSYTSSLSPPPSSDGSERAKSQRKENVPVQSLPTANSSDRVIQNSDDEDDSDDSLEELSTILAARFPNSATRSKMSGDSIKPSTPAASRHQTRTRTFHISPLPALSKNKFDLKSLISHEQDDEAAEISSKRYKALLNEPDVEEDDEDSPETAKRVKFHHSALLESVVAGGEDGGAYRVARAIQRTEATVTEQQWYFFETGTRQGEPERRPFPVASVPEIWKDVLVDPKMRQQTFVFGLAEDMVYIGQELPDELFLWMLDEVSVEARDPLRTAYLNVIRQSHDQIKRLVTIDAIWSMFLRLGTSSKANLIEVLKPVNKLKDPYPNRGWANLLSMIKFFAQVAKLLDEKPRRYLIFILLKMSLDKMVSENVDILDSVQDAIAQLCHYVIDWKETCKLVCENLFLSTASAPLRLQITESISSQSPRTHDLRRRLAACFFHNDPSYASKESYHTTTLAEVLATLQTPRFRIRAPKDVDGEPGTDYLELRALIYLLDVAIDDGIPPSSERDLSDRVQEDMHNEEVEELSRQLDWIGSKIQTGGAAFFTRLETKEALTLVQQRAVAMMRTRPKPKNAWYNSGEAAKKVETFGGEKKGMASFLKKELAG